MMKKMVDMLCGGGSDQKSVHQQIHDNNKKIRGKVVLMKKNVLDSSDLGSSFLDRVHELFGRGVSLQLISSVRGDSGQASFLFYLNIYSLDFI